MIKSLISLPNELKDIIMDYSFILSNKSMYMTIVNILLVKYKNELGFEFPFKLLINRYPIFKDLELNVSQTFFASDEPIHIEIIPKWARVLCRIISYQEQDGEKDSFDVPLWEARYCDYLYEIEHIFSDGSTLRLNTYYACILCEGDTHNIYLCPNYIHY